VIAAALVATAINVVFLLALDAALRRTEAGKGLHGAAAAGGICTLSLAEAVFLRRTPIVEATPVLLMIACLGACVVSDVVAGLILDAITFPTLAAMVVLSAPNRFASAAEGALCCASLIFVLYGASRGRGIGLGDVKLAACIGAALGPMYGAQSIGLAFAIGGPVAAALLLTGRAKRTSSVPFAPYLAAGAFAVLGFPNA